MDRDGLEHELEPEHLGRERCVYPGPPATLLGRRSLLNEARIALLNKWQKAHPGVVLFNAGGTVGKDYTRKGVLGGGLLEAWTGGDQRREGQVLARAPARDRLRPGELQARILDRSDRTLGEGAGQLHLPLRVLRRAQRRVDAPVPVRGQPHLQRPQLLGATERTAFGLDGEPNTSVPSWRSLELTDVCGRPSRY